MVRSERSGSKGQFPPRAGRFTFQHGPRPPQASDSQASLQGGSQCPESFGSVPVKPDRWFWVGVPLSPLTRLKSFDASPSKRGNGVGLSLSNGTAEDAERALQTAFRERWAATRGAGTFLRYFVTTTLVRRNARFSMRAQPRLEPLAAFRALAFATRQQVEYGRWMTVAEASAKDDLRL